MATSRYGWSNISLVNELKEQIWTYGIQHLDRTLGAPTWNLILNTLLRKAKAYDTLKHHKDTTTPAKNS